MLATDAQIFNVIKILICASVAIFKFENEH